ncbi:family 11 glycoside hydrolase [Piromyces sp. E2]|nr:family 11 glycoside hydrolase [Piromyces sp. E2]|eukprot:OUM68482.1 family 11 glycoside hydrolase [Piromyces sp. E2]
MKYSTVIYTLTFVAAASAQWGNQGWNMGNQGNQGWNMGNQGIQGWNMGNQGNQGWNMGNQGWNQGNQDWNQGWNQGNQGWNMGNQGNQGWNQGNQDWNQGNQNWNQGNQGGGSSGASDDYDFCSSTGHSGESVKVTSNEVGSINGIGYELWADSGNNSATFYDDGSFSCSFSSAKDYLCRSGLSFDSTQTHEEIGHMYADFKLVKQNIQNVDYSYIGIYGWSRDPLVEFYVVDNWLSQWRPGDWVGNKKHGDFTIDGAKYTVFENTRTGPSIDGDNTTFKQFFSIRQDARSCGRIDITAHFEQWEKLGMKLGKMHEAKVLGEAGSTGGGTTGTADFPYAKVYVGSPDAQNTNKEPEVEVPVKNPTGSCPAAVLAQGYKCCSAGCEVVYTDQDADWGVENGDWCGCGGGEPVESCPAAVLAQGYKCCSAGCVIVYTDQDADWGMENGDWCGCGNGK